MGIIEIKRTWLSVLLGLKSACGFWYWVSCSLPVMRNFFMWHMTSLYLELTSDYHLAYFSELSPKQIVWTIENKLTSLLPPVIRYLNFKCTWVNPFESELILSLKKKKFLQSFSCVLRWERGKDRHRYIKLTPQVLGWQPSFIAQGPTVCPYAATAYEARASCAVVVRTWAQNIAVVSTKWSNLTNMREKEKTRRGISELSSTTADGRNI